MTKFKATLSGIDIKKYQQTIRQRFNFIKGLVFINAFFLFRSIINISFFPFSKLLAHCKFDAIVFVQKSKLRTNYLLINSTLFLLLVSTQHSFSQQKNIDSLISLINTTKEDSNRVKVFYQLTDALTLTEPQKAIQYANEGISLSKKIAFKSGISMCLNALGLVYYQIGEFDTALIYYEKSSQIASELNDSIGIAVAYDNIAVIYIHLGNSDKALDLRKKANDIYLSRNEKSSLANGYVWIGNINKDQGKFSIALENYLKALKIFEDENDEDNIGFALINISSVYRYLKQYDKAKQYAYDAKIKFAKSKNGKDGVGVSCYRLALIYSEELNYDNAISSLREAKVIFEETNNNYFLTIVNQQLGTNYLKKGSRDIALNYFINALIPAEKIGDINLISSILGSIGFVYQERGDYLKALEYVNKSEKLFKETNDKNSLLNLSKTYIGIYSLMNRPDSVLKYFQMYQELADTIYNEQSNKSIAEMQTKYETEKKDREIVLLNLENQKKRLIIIVFIIGIIVLSVISTLSFLSFKNKKKRVQAELNQQVSENNMKFLRSQMNPHFIFNCVHTFQSLLNMAKISETKNGLEKFSILARNVLENSEKKDIPLENEIKTLELYMDLENLRFINPFKYKIIIDSDIDQKITLLPPLILQPFVENSIKHGFTEKVKSCHLKIEIKRENEMLICIVEDNGLGRKESMKIKPTSGYKKESKGLRITEERLLLMNKMKKTNCCFLIDDLEDNNNTPLGTRIKLFLPYELSI